MAQTGTDRKVLTLTAVLVAVAVGWVFHKAAAILQPLVIATLFAGLLQPVVYGLRRWRIPPVVTVVVLTTLLFFVLVQVGFLVQRNLQSFLPDTTPVEQQVPAQEPSAASEPEQQWDTLDPLSERADALAAQSGGWPVIVAGLEQRMKQSPMPDPIREVTVRWLRNLDLEGLMGSLIGSGIDFVRGLSLVMIYLVFIFAEAAVFRRKILVVAGERSADATVVIDSISRGIQRYLGIHTLISLATGTLCYFGLVMLGVPFALLFGLVAFLLNYIPTFGSILAGLLAVATSLAVSDSLTTPLLVFLLYLAVNMALGNFLEPLILGRELNLSPLVILISVVVWGSIWGIVGALISVPLTSTLQIVLANLETTRPVAILLSGGPPREPT